MPSRSEYMALALREAKRGRGRTSPNPMVGCVIVRRGEVVGVGHHSRVGAAHAEIAALRRAGPEARGADVYVNLEPCDHEGRTGPCTEALIQAKVRRVVVGIKDPNPLVNGRGLRRLRRAGIVVETGVLADECRHLNEAFELAMRRSRPLVVAKIAQSLDGRVATRQGESQWITGAKARQAGHRLRNELDAIVVGVGTVLADDPRLTCRVRGGRDPIRIILDTHARTSPRANVVRASKRSKAPTWIFVGPEASSRRRAALERAGAQVTATRLKGGRIALLPLLETLHQRQLVSLLVEGGPSVLGSFFDAERVDKIHAFVAPMVIGGTDALSSVGARGVAQLRNSSRLQRVQFERLGDDLHIVGYVPNRS